MREKWRKKRMRRLKRKRQYDKYKNIQSNIFLIQFLSIL
ncbi:unnamed protein product [Paramecium primaurelia]|uniref:60S ribosomal protein L41 n=1 Tax=Paramecium primaurelia TaxID=5886 RepID=A0A8S1LF47_PARPR|nr:unnamed protein product [Paramecium primaurelia]